jgi:phosphatidylglycerophosphate synthase
MAPNPSSAALREGVTAFLSGLCDTTIWGLSGTERTERMLRRAGFDTVMIAGEPSRFGGTVLMVRADAIIDEALLAALQGRPDSVLVAPGERGYLALAALASPHTAGPASRFLHADSVRPADIEQAGLAALEAQDLSGSYNHALRKRAQPLAAVLTPDNARQMHRQTFDASYKGVTDLVTKFVWPPIAYPITRALARLHVTPNQVTAVGFTLAVATGLLFWHGYFASGLACAWIMALLDTVDGKLARVTLTSSRWGNAFDHGIDLVAPPVWWLCWWVGLGDHSSAWIFWSVWVVLGGHLAGKLVEQAFISTFALKVHIWQPFDSLFRLIAARRNPNLVILTAATLIGAPEAAYLALGAWIVASFDVHTIRYIQALVLRSKGMQIRSWLTG